MGKVWFTADTHFGHANIIKPTFDTPRDYFQSIEEHDETLISNWNAVVRPRDQVFHLGDFQYRCKPERAARIFSRLNGEKHLVIGNHDDANTLALPWASPPSQMRIESVDGQRIFMAHYGVRSWPGVHRGTIHLYGHSHGTLPGTQQSLDVGVDCFGFMPVGLETIRVALADNCDIEGVVRPAPPKAKPETSAEDEAGYDGP